MGIDPRGLRNAIGDYEARLDAKDAEIERLKAEVGRLRERMVALQQQIAVTEADIEHADLRAERDEARAARDRYEVMWDDLVVEAVPELVGRDRQGTDDDQDDGDCWKCRVREALGGDAKYDLKRAIARATLAGTEEATDGE